MFLELKEILFSKTRYIIIISIMILVTYLVLFLTRLAYGLAQENRMVIDAWDADSILITNDTNNAITRSQMKIGEASQIKVDDKALLGVAPVAIPF